MDENIGAGCRTDKVCMVIRFHLDTNNLTGSGFWRYM